jgi:hypothetical protein
MKRLTRVVAGAMCLAGMLVPSLAYAQLGASGIAGIVRDASGAVLPGVTVEATSPALIERVRTVTTDEQGQYRIVDLRTGVYTVTFALAGFSTVRREGVELAANFTATVNAELKVGGLEETITVTGASPVVDVQNTSGRNIVSREVLDTIPSGRTLPAYAALTPGMSIPAAGQDVGGSKGETFFTGSIHGSKEFISVLEGFITTTRGGGGRIFVPNPGSAQEVSVELGGGSAEFEIGGVQMNFIPREGGNRFHGDLFGNYSSRALQGTNVSDEIRARGLSESSINKVKEIYEFTGSVGGPIVRDKVWFFTSHRWWGASATMAGIYFNSTPTSFVYTPDLNQPAINNWVNQHHDGRVTWQASPRNKFAASYNYQLRCDCYRGIDGSVVSAAGLPSNGILTPEATHVRRYRSNVVVGSWTRPQTSKLLFEAAMSFQDIPWWNRPQPGVSDDTVAVQETSTNLYYRAPFGLQDYWNTHYYYRFASSYVTGTHAFKSGVYLTTGTTRINARVQGDMTYALRSGIPQQITVWTTPYDQYSDVNGDLGLFAQDQWTLRRLTVNAGLRADYLNMSVPDQHLAATRFAPAADYQGVNCTPCWWDLSPRVSGSYDLFGNGKTAAKVSVGRYVAYSQGLAAAMNPVNTRVNSANRAWQDGNGDFVPQENELGPLSPAAFGTIRTVTSYSPDLTNGFGLRDYNWQFSTSVQHELLPKVAVNVGYFRTWWKNFTATNNQAVTAADYDPYCITLPSDARLPGGGGNQVCGLYDVKQNKFGQVQNLVDLADRFGEQTEVFNGVDVTVSARFTRSAFLQGGLSTGKTNTNNCYANGRPDLTPSGFAANTPRIDDFCNVTSPFSANTQVKFNASYVLPWDLQVSGAFQNLPGIPVTASYVATSGQIAPSLGRPLSGSVTQVTISNVVKPYTLFEDRFTQIDLRLTKIFRFGSTQLQGTFDLYNLLNASPVLTENTRYGTAWRTPTGILDARLAKFGAKFTF